jgi:hypothetical protein
MGPYLKQSILTDCGTPRFIPDRGSRRNEKRTSSKLFLHNYITQLDAVDYKSHREGWLV